MCTAYHTTQIESLISAQTDKSNSLMAHGPKLHFKKLTQDPATNTLENKHQPGRNDNTHLHNIRYAVHLKALLIFGSIVIVRPARESNLSVHEPVWKEKRAACAS